MFSFSVCFSFKRTLISLNCKSNLLFDNVMESWDCFVFYGFFYNGYLCKSKHSCHHNLQHTSMSLQQEVVISSHLLGQLYYPEHFVIINWDTNPTTITTGLRDERWMVKNNVLKAAKSIVVCYLGDATHKAVADLFKTINMIFLSDTHLIFIYNDG